MFLFKCGFLILFFSSSGCSYFEHHEEIRRLQHYSASQDQKEAAIKKQNRNFEKLLRVAQSGKLSQYSTQRKIYRAFGAPVLDYPDKKNLEQEVWLYRYSTQFFGSQKVYLYFDLSGRLDHFQVVGDK